MFQPRGDVVKQSSDGSEAVTDNCGDPTHAVKGKDQASEAEPQGKRREVSAEVRAARRAHAPRPDVGRAKYPGNWEMGGHAGLGWSANQTVRTSSGLLER